MNITFDTNNLSDLDIAILGMLVDGNKPMELVEAKPAPKPAAAAKPAPKPAAAAKPAPKPEPEPEPEPDPEPEPEEDLLGGDDPTQEECVKAATDLMAAGKRDAVKAALAAAGAPRVGALKDMPGSARAAFMSALGA